MARRCRPARAPTATCADAGGDVAYAGRVGVPGVHPTQISEGFQYATHRAVEYLEQISHKVDLHDREALLKSATTSLNSKVRPLERARRRAPAATARDP